MIMGVIALPVTDTAKISCSHLHSNKVTLIKLGSVKIT